jgi:hypothetical protein
MPELNSKRGSSGIDPVHPRVDTYLMDLSYLKRFRVDIAASAMSAGLIAVYLYVLEYYLS